MSELSYEGRTVFCADVSASATYYEKVLGLRRAFEADGDIGMTLPVVDSPEAEITLYLHHATAPTPVDLGSFRVPDVDAFIDRYRAAGYPVVAEPADTTLGNTRSNHQRPRRQRSPSGRLAVTRCARQPRTLRHPP